MSACKEKFPDWKDFPNGLPHWKDFPNGLRVLLVDEDTKVLSEIKRQLEDLQYVVSAFTKREEALGALRAQQNAFHVALVEAMPGDSSDGFKILEAARPLPTILMSKNESMTTMMQGIALGAADFLQKPLSDDKLKSLWHHVVRKVAFKPGDPVLVTSLLPVKAVAEYVFSPSPSSGEAGPVVCPDSEVDIKPKDLEWIAGASNPTSCGEAALCERLPAPSTPQLEQTGRMNSQEDSVFESLGSDSSVRGKAEGEDPESDPTSVRKAAPCSKLKFENDVGAIGEPGTKSAEIDIKAGTESTELDIQAELDIKLDDYPQNPVGPEAELGSESAEIDIRAELDIKLEDYPAVLKLELDDSLDDIGLSNGIVVDCDGASALDIGSCLLAPLPEASLDIHMNIESLDAGEVHDTEIGEQEALLLAKAAKAGDESLQRTPSINCLSVDSGHCCRGEKKSDGNKVNSKATSGRRKVKVDWTPDLHRRFVHAVEQLGVEKAIPSRILELMGPHCLTRHNIASHLQKYRSHRRHLLAREAEAATWHQRKPNDPNAWARNRRDGNAWLVPHHTTPPPIQPRPPMGLTPIQPHPSSHCHPMGPPMHLWGHPTMDHTAGHMWQQPQMATPTTWQAPDGSYWQHPGIDAWVHPMPGMGTRCYPQAYRVPVAPMSPFASPMTTAALAADSYFADESMPTSMYPTSPDDPELTVAAGAAASSRPSDIHPPKEILDAAISEALANPCTPLPLGLKPPSMEGVMAELQRQGINTVPPPPPS